MVRQYLMKKIIFKFQVSKNRPNFMPSGGQTAKFFNALFNVIIIVSYSQLYEKV